MLSGIGDRDKLAAVGIDAAVELPGVGSNLQDHPFCVGIWESAIGKSLADAEKPQAAAEWLLRRTGPLASTVAEAFLFTRSDGGDGPPTCNSTSRPRSSPTTGSRSSTATPTRSARCWSSRRRAARSP